MQENDELRARFSEIKDRNYQLEELLKETNIQYDGAEALVKELSDAQIEMKMLIDQERTIYNEDREKLEDDLMRVIKMGEAKIRLVRNKLLTLYEGNIDQICDIPTEDIIDQIANKLSKFRSV